MPLSPDDIPKNLALEVYRDAAQPSVRTVGESLALAVRVALGLPNLVLGTLDQAIGTAQARVAEKLAARGAKPEDVRTPLAEIAVPAIGMLRSATLSEPLREMFLELLTTASHAPTADTAHPAFARVIEQLSAAEAALLDQISRLYASPHDNVAVIDVRLNQPTSPVSYISLDTLLTTMGLPLTEPVPRATVDNLIRLGLIAVHPDRQLANAAAYQPIESLDRVIGLLNVDQTATWIQRGHISFTHFGAQFLAAVTDPTTRAKPQPAAPQP
jgi:hypothetical protein